jgi:hypothetical protein
MTRAHSPSEPDKAKVIMLVTNGVRQDRIAEHLEIDPKTLRKHYAHELEFGTEFLLSKVLGNLTQIAIRGKGSAAVRAATYLLSSRGGYREHSVLGVEPTGAAAAYFADAAESKSVRERILARIEAIKLEESVVVTEPATQQPERKMK